jgi:hypothetical protein
MDSERLERITSPTNDAAGLSDEDALLREAWVGMAQSLSSSPKTWPLDPDDVYAEIVKRERRQRRSFWYRGAAVAASLLLMFAAVMSVVWNSGGDRVGRKPEMANTLKTEDAVVWEDGWESSALEVETELFACAELFQPPSNEAWIDQRIQLLFEECVRVWAML